MAKTIKDLAVMMGVPGALRDPQPIVGKEQCDAALNALASEPCVSVVVTLADIDPDTEHAFDCEGAELAAFLDT